MSNSFNLHTPESPVRRSVSQPERKSSEARGGGEAGLPERSVVGAGLRFMLVESCGAGARHLRWTAARARADIGATVLAVCAAGESHDAVFVVVYIARVPEQLCRRMHAFRVVDEEQRPLPCASSPELDVLPVLPNTASLVPKTVPVLRVVVPVFPMLPIIACPRPVSQPSAVGNILVDPVVDGAPLFGLVAREYHVLQRHVASFVVHDPAKGARPTPEIGEFDARHGELAARQHIEEPSLGLLEGPVDPGRNGLDQGWGFGHDINMCGLRVVGPRDVDGPEGYLVLHAVIGRQKHIALERARARVSQEGRCHTMGAVILTVSTVGLKIKQYAIAARIVHLAWTGLPPHSEQPKKGGGS